MSERDIFREVEEDIRREELARLWDKYGLIVLIAALIIVLGVAVANGWRWWNNKQAAENGAIFNHAVTLVDEGKTDEAAGEFNKVINNAHGGYRLLARFRLAALDAAKGRTTEAVSAYDALSNNTAVNEMFRGLARIKAASLRVDAASWDEMKNRLDQLNSPENPWRHSAMELLGLSAYRTGKSDDARRLFGELQTDLEAPDALRERAKKMLALLDGAGKSDGNTRKEPQSHEKTQSQGGKTQDGEAQNAKAQDAKTQ
jgi:hypothetical protein